ncbi:MAG: zinc ribbon domain-containing protein [Clostridia bacterium]|nr:zinc ribbon domain-containing protein [Clostridia bacterium]
MKFCSHCGKEINDEAVVCPFCGCATEKFNEKSKMDQPIVINNNNNASSSAAAAAAAGGRRRHSLLFDIIMICFTGGLWIIWMIVRPK